ncbi:hypothetical protein GCM10020295_67740 [Streptomyces cinereospinus]
MVGTAHGVRVLMGDVRGHGPDASRAAGAVLDGFHGVAHEPGLGRVLHGLQEALAQHLRGRPPDERAEEFVTALLLEIGPDGEVRALNCGHPWPYRLGGPGAEPLSRAEPLPPLGVFPLPADPLAVRLGELHPGEALFLCTDGAEDARDAQGRFFPLADALDEAMAGGAVSPRAVVGGVLTRLLRHTRGRPPDDVALLVLHHSWCDAADAAPDTPRQRAEPRDRP